MTKPYFTSKSDEWATPQDLRVDLTNLLNAIMDILCFYEVILDDNRDIVYSVDGSRVLYSKENPRTEVTL